MHWRLSSPRFARGVDTVDMRWIADAVLIFANWLFPCFPERTGEIPCSRFAANSSPPQGNFAIIWAQHSIELSVPRIQLHNFLLCSALADDASTSFDMGTYQTLLECADVTCRERCSADNVPPNVGHSGTVSVFQR